MRALLLPVLSLLALSACADPPAPAAPTPTQTQAAAKPAAPREKRYAELTEADCRAWADQFETRLKEATSRRVDECAAKVKAAGGTPSDSTKDVAETNAETDRLHALILDQCGQQVGAAYVQDDAVCYMGAKKMEDWKECPFQSMFFADYKAVAKNHQQMFDDRCRAEMGKTAGTKSPNG